MNNNSNSNNNGGGSNGGPGSCVFAGMPHHLVEFSPNSNNSNGSGGAKRHFQAREFTDPAWRETRDAAFARSQGLFEDLKPSQQ